MVIKLPMWKINSFRTKQPCVIKRLFSLRLILLIIYLCELVHGRQIIELYLQPRSLQETLTIIEQLRHTISRNWTSVEYRFRLWWVKLRSFIKSHKTYKLVYKKKKIGLTWLEIFSMYIYRYIYIRTYILCTHILMLKFDVL